MLFVASWNIKVIVDCPNMIAKTVIWWCSIFCFQIRIVCEILTCIGCSITLVADIFEISTQGIFSFLKNCVSRRRVNQTQDKLGKFSMHETSVTDLLPYYYFLHHWDELDDSYRIVKYTSLIYLKVFVYCWKLTLK